MRPVRLLCDVALVGRPLERNSRVRLVPDRGFAFLLAMFVLQVNYGSIQ